MRRLPPPPRGCRRRPGTGCPPTSTLTARSSSPSRTRAIQHPVLDAGVPGCREPRRRRPVACVVRAAAVEPCGRADSCPASAGRNPLFARHGESMTSRRLQDRNRLSTGSGVAGAALRRRQLACGFRSTRIAAVRPRPRIGGQLFNPHDLSLDGALVLPAPG